MKIFAKLATGLICSAVLGSAASASVTEAPCYDGWQEDESGSSVLYTLSRKERRDYRWVIQPPSAELECVHRMPSGVLYMVMTYNDQVRFVILDPRGGEARITGMGIWEEEDEA